MTPLSFAPPPVSASLTAILSTLRHSRLRLVLVVLAGLLAAGWLGGGKVPSGAAPVALADDLGSSADGADRWPASSRPAGLVRAGRGPVLGAGSLPPKAVAAPATVPSVPVRGADDGPEGIVPPLTGHPAASGLGSRRNPTGPPARIPPFS